MLPLHAVVALELAFEDCASSMCFPGTTIAFASFILAIAFCPLTPTMACGIDWRVPVNHFEGVEEHGYVSYSEKIGEVDLGDGLKLPIIIDFQSNRATVSPYLGYGWLLALVESNFIQMGENSFRMTQPDGWHRMFWRKNPGDCLLFGQGGWKAEIRGDWINAYADCGWKISFRNGAIVELTSPKNRRLEFCLAGHMVNAIRENGVNKLEVEHDSFAGSVSALRFNGKRLELSLAGKPEVQVIGGQAVIGGVVQSLNRVLPEGGPPFRYEFEVTQKIQPSLKIIDQSGQQREIIWDAETKRIVRDGSWVYDINLGSAADGNAAITRTNHKHESEYWFYDGLHGRETTERLGQGKTVREWFTSGSLAGTTKTIVRYPPGKNEVHLKRCFNDKGQLIREIIDDKLYRYQYQPNEISAYQDEKLIWVKKFDNAGRLTSILGPDRKCGSIIKTLADGSVQLIPLSVPSLRNRPIGN